MENKSEAGLASSPASGVSAGTMQVSTPQFDFSYLSFNSLYRNRSTTLANKMIFNIVPQSDSLSGVTGATKQPTQVVQLQISPIVLSRKFNIPVSVIEDLYYGKLYVLVTEFNT